MKQSLPPQAKGSQDLDLIVENGEDTFSKEKHNGQTKIH